MTAKKTQAKAELEQAMDQTNAQAAQQVPASNTQTTPQYDAGKNHTLRLVAFIFALVNTIAMGLPGLFFALLTPLFAIAATANAEALAGVVMAPFLLIPLAWMIPMTVRTYKIYKGRKPNTVAFGVCTLIFVNLVSGILLLCSDKDA